MGEAYSSRPVCLSVNTLPPTPVSPTATVVILCVCLLTLYHPHQLALQLPVCLPVNTLPPTPVSL